MKCGLFRTRKLDTEGELDQVVAKVHTQKGPGATSTAATSIIFFFRFSFSATHSRAVGLNIFAFTETSFVENVTGPETDEASPVQIGAIGRICSGEVVHSATICEKFV